MLKSTLNALKGSINKWKAIVNGTGTDDSIYNCPLCDRFHPRYKLHPTDTCPCSYNHKMKCDLCFVSLPGDDKIRLIIKSKKEEH